MNSFVFADLINPPLPLIYRKCYGSQLTLRLLAVFWTAMSMTSLAVEYLFGWLGLTSPSGPQMVMTGGVDSNYSTFLNTVALVGFAVL